MKKARVLIRCVYGAPNDVVYLDDKALKSAVKSGFVDPSLAAVEYASRMAEDRLETPSAIEKSFHISGGFVDGNRLNKTEQARLVKSLLKTDSCSELFATQMFVQEMTLVLSALEISSPGIAPRSLEMQLGDAVTQAGALLRTIAVVQRDARLKIELESGFLAASRIPDHDIGANDMASTLQRLHADLTVLHIAAKSVQSAAKATPQSSAWQLHASKIAQRAAWEWLRHFKTWPTAITRADGTAFTRWLKAFGDAAKNSSTDELLYPKPFVIGHGVAKTAITLLKKVSNLETEYGGLIQSQ